MLIAVIIALVVLYVLVKGLVGSAAPGQKPIRTFHKQVHGIFHKNADGTSRQKIIRECSEGEQLELIPEPDNPVDPDAIKVCRRDGEQIGYWPAEDGEMIEQLRKGWCFRVTIDEIYSMPENERKRGVRMRVDVVNMAPRKSPASR